MIIVNRTPSRGREVALLIEKHLSRGSNQSLALITPKTKLKARHPILKYLNQSSLLAYLDSMAFMLPDCGAMTILPEAKNPTNTLDLLPYISKDKKIVIHAPLVILTTRTLNLLNRNKDLIDIISPDWQSLEDGALSIGIRDILKLKLYRCSDIKNIVPSTSIITGSPQRMRDIQNFHGWLQHHLNLTPREAEVKMNFFYPGDPDMAQCFGWVRRPGYGGFYTVP